jgi:hypothetical protein
MDDQLLRDALRSSAAAVGGDARPAAASEIRALGDQRRRRRTIQTVVGLAAVAVTVMLLRPGGITADIPGEAAGRPTTAGGMSPAMVLAGWAGVGLAASLALLALMRAWHWRTANGTGWSVGAALLAVSAAASAGDVWRSWLSLPGQAYVQLDTIVYWLLPLLLVVSSGCLLAGPRARTSSPVWTSLAATALSGGVIVAGPLGLGTWWALTGTGGWILVAGVVQVIALGALTLGWVRAGAARWPWGSRRVDTMVAIVVLSVAASTLLGTGFLRSREVYDHGGLTVGLALGLAALLSIPTVSVCLSTSRRQAGRVVLGAVVAAALVNITYLIRSLPEPLGAGFRAAYLPADVFIAAWTFGGALALWIASRIVVPRDGVDPDEESGD